jgi:hypothetical protein
VTHADDCDCSACWSVLSAVSDPPPGTEWADWSSEPDALWVTDRALAVDWTGLHPPEEF